MRKCENKFSHSMICMPPKADFEWGITEASKKKNQDFSTVEYLSIEEGLCVQIMHIGAYDDEPASVEKMDFFIKEQGYRNDFTDTRRHHEIYLSDTRKVAPENGKRLFGIRLGRNKTDCIHRSIRQWEVTLAMGILISPNLK